MADFILTERRADGVELIRFNRPKVNAFSSAMLDELAVVTERLCADADLKAVVVTGNEKVFAAGAEISELLEPGTPQLTSFRRAFDGLAAIPRPVIAAVSGYALGGGLEAALACDFRLATESATLGLPEAKLGVFPAGGGTQRLTRLVGPARAKDLIWTGRNIRPGEALVMGLVDRVVPAAGYLDAALEWAAELASGAVLAMGLSKQAIDGGLDGPLADGLDLERRLFDEVVVTADAKAGIDSFFAHGPGKATFSGK